MEKHIAQQIQQSQPCHILIDIIKAFDRVWYEGISCMACHDNMGIHIELINILKSLYNSTTGYIIYQKLLVIFQLQ